LLLYLIEIGVAVVVVTALALYLLRNVLLGTPTKAYAATRGELVQSVVASGRVISPQRVTVALQGSGRVQRVAVAEGQVVEAGQLLIELDNSDSRASLAQANAATAQAEAKLRQLGELAQPSSSRRRPARGGCGGQPGRQCAGASQDSASKRVNVFVQRCRSSWHKGLNKGLEKSDVAMNPLLPFEWVLALMFLR
jgi:multidrug efflux pump subunit AcrA (membrane-fusion protein)